MVKGRYNLVDTPTRGIIGRAHVDNCNILT